jgi:hypothetical protein
MPWLTVNQTLLALLRAVPAPLLALEVQRAEIPGHPGACFVSLVIEKLLFVWVRLFPRFIRAKGRQ